MTNAKKAMLAYRIFQGGIMLGFAAVIVPGPIMTPLGWVGGVMFLFGGGLALALDNDSKEA